ncbi:hypothetical protein [Leptospira stimsonii]|uniref:MORN repeat protein n=1 Tax=Leptospira stimsonii TaxID=2202203 RepID=A0A396Z9R7_9LEPT|nr:hypothetical protein [Leptospira stimsonii]RHX89870.1 hypothetical protein DLM75_13015 [Leptospira stimsonii]
MNRLQKLIYITAFLFSISISAEEKVRTCIEGDCQNGRGKTQSEEGVIAEGTFKNGKPHGVIKAYKPENPEKYSTMYFINGKIDTSKPVSDWFEDGDHYEGYFNSEMNMHGKGKLTFLDGDVKCIYEGFFANGKKQGSGKLDCEDGMHEVGEWKNDRRQFNVEIDFVCRSLERVDKWEGGSVSGKFKFTIMRNAKDLESNLKEWNGIKISDDWNGYTIAEAIYNGKEVTAHFLLFIPSEQDKVFDAIVSKKRDLNIQGMAVGVANAERKFPVIFVEKIK